MTLLRTFRVLRLLTLISTTMLAWVAHQPTDSTHFRTVRYGPFSLLDHSRDTVRVFVEIGRVHLDTAQFGRSWSESDYSTTFLDQLGNVLSRTVDRYDYGEGSTTIRPIQLVVPKVGPLVLLMSQTVPSAPPMCTDGQLFGLDQFDHLVPFSANITACGGMQASTFRPVLIHVGLHNETDSEYATDEHGEPAIETDDCMPNFTIFHLHPVWWRHSSPPTFYQTKYRVLVDSSAAAYSRMRYRQHATDTVVALYPKPTKSGPRPSTIYLRPTSSLKFIDAVNQQGWWLHVTVDGLEGYVTETDFPELGLSDIY